MVITTVLVSIVMLIVWQWHCLAVSVLLCLFIAMEGVLLSAVLYKVPDSPSLHFAFKTGARAACALRHAITVTLLKGSCQSIALSCNTESLSVKAPKNGSLHSVWRAATEAECERRSRREAGSRWPSPRRCCA